MTIEQIALAGLGVATVLHIGVTAWVFWTFTRGMELAEGIIDGGGMRTLAHTPLMTRIDMPPVEVTIGPCDCAEKYPEGIIDTASEEKR